MQDRTPIPAGAEHGAALAAYSPAPEIVPRWRDRMEGIAAGVAFLIAWLALISPLWLPVLLR
jgi:hypothetical protein